MHSRRSLLGLLLAVAALLGSGEVWANRYYSSETGRFISRDPIGLFGGLNMYEYVYSRPTALFDSVGLFGEKKIPVKDGEFEVSIEEKNIGRFLKRGRNVKMISAVIKFKINQKCCECNVIDLIQVVKKSEPLPEDDGRRKWQDKSGAFVDVYQEAKNPFYRTGGKADVDDGDYGSPGDCKGNPAILKDSPYWSWKAPESPPTGIKNYQVCAVCRDGKDAGRIYGCISWGIGIKAGELIDEDWPPRKTGDSELPGYHSAVEAWNKYAKSKGEGHEQAPGYNGP